MATMIRRGTIIGIRRWSVMSGRLFGACQYSAAFERTHSGLQQHDGNRAQSESEHPLFAEKTHLKLFTKVHLSCQLFCEEQPHSTQSGCTTGKLPFWLGSGRSSMPDTKKSARVADFCIALCSLPSGSALTTNAPSLGFLAGQVTDIRSIFNSQDLPPAELRLQSSPFPQPTSTACAPATPSNASTKNSNAEPASLPSSQTRPLSFVSSPLSSAKSAKTG